MPLAHSSLEFAKSYTINTPYSQKAYYIGIHERDEQKFHFFVSGDVNWMRSEVQLFLIPPDKINESGYYPLTFIFPNFDDENQGLFKDLHSLLDNLLSSREFRSNMN